MTKNQDYPSEAGLHPGLAGNLCHSNGVLWYLTHGMANIYKLKFTNLL